MENDQQTVGINYKRIWNEKAYSNSSLSISNKFSKVNFSNINTDSSVFKNIEKSIVRNSILDTSLRIDGRDLETVSLALTAAETGHLVFGTLHTSGAPATINRIIDVFPAGQKDQIRSVESVDIKKSFYINNYPTTNK